MGYRSLCWSHHLRGKKRSTWRHVDHWLCNALSRLVPKQVEPHCPLFSVTLLEEANGSGRRCVPKPLLVRYPLQCPRLSRCRKSMNSFLTKDLFRTDCFLRDLFWLHQSAFAGKAHLATSSVAIIDSDHSNVQSQHKNLLLNAVSW